MSPAAAKEDIRRGKSELKSLLGRDVFHFSYPYGMRRFFSESLRDYCRELGFRTVTNAIPGVLHRPQSAFSLNRTLWHLDQPVSWNLQNLSIDGQHFESLTGRSVIGQRRGQRIRRVHQSQSTQLTPWFFTL